MGAFVSLFLVVSVASAAPGIAAPGEPAAVWTLLPLAFLYGLLHALDADHVAAVTSFVARTPKPLPAAWTSLRWGIGHTITLLALGIVALLVGASLPAAFERYAEMAVGVVLAALGIWLLKEFVVRRIHLHTHAHETEDASHAHLHGHEADEAHGHRHSPVLVGLLHGAAGSAGALVMIPVAAKASLAASFLYLACFSLAIVAAMVVIGVAASRAYGALLSRRAWLYETARATTGAVTLALGVAWIAGNL